MGPQPATFSVFPPPPSVPRIAVPDPHNRKPSLSSNVVMNTTQDSIIIKLEEPPVPRVPNAHKYRATSRKRTASPEGAKTLINASPDLRQKSLDALRKPSHNGNASSKTDSPDLSQLDSTSTLVRTTTGDGNKSPVVPIRSMFPVYNPNVPLSEQHYYPQRPMQAYLPHMPVSKFSPRQELKSQMASPIDQQLGARTAPQSVVDIPVDTMSVRETSYSSLRSLERLWDATHGTEPDTEIGTFDLEMARTSEATFTFGSSPEVPFYTVTTYDTNEIAVIKTCPRKRTLTCDVALASIESVERRVPPNDGLVSFIFPKLAAMLAINQSAALAEEHGLAPTHRDDVQAAAMKRAAEQEASYLRYNYSARHYELEHPAIARKVGRPNFTATPSSPKMAPSGKNKPSLCITVHQTKGQTTHGKPSIIVTAPSAPSNNNSTPSLNQNPAPVANQGIRLSTINNSETSECALASLDFHTNTLHIDASRILTLMPSLFAIDSIVSAIICVAIADHATNVVMGGMSTWLPKPRNLNLDTLSGAGMSWGVSSNNGDARDSKSVKGMGIITTAPMDRSGAEVALPSSEKAPNFYATYAEREEAELEALKMQKDFVKDIKGHKKAKTKAAKKSSRSWFGHRSAGAVEDEERGEIARASSKKKKQITLEESDLEKLGHYQNGSRQGQELPGVTRAALSLLVGGLRLIVWFLTCIVRLLAWVLVSGTRCVTSERF